MENKRCPNVSHVVMCDCKDECATLKSFIISMTPKEKAEELVTKFQQSRDAEDYNDVRDIHAAIRCALIAVDEILRYVDRDIRFWLEVKDEIEKL